MNQLPPDARDLLSRARAEQARSTAAMRTRVRAGITRSVSMAPLAHASPAAAKAKLTSSSLLKLAVATATVATFAGLGMYEKPATPAKRPALQQFVAPPPVTATPASPASPLATPDAPATLVELVTPRRQQLVRDDLSAELQLIERANQALRSGDGRAAMEALRVHRARFSRGQLSAEREGLLLIASCMLAQAGAPERAARSSAVSPLLQGRIASACAKAERP